MEQGDEPGQVRYCLILIVWIFFKKVANMATFLNFDRTGL